MQFLDQAKIYIRAGSGGNGCISFHREKFITEGGPDGGNGGHGGDVIIEATEDLNTLLHLRYQQHFFAQNGNSGGRSNKTGKSGEDLVVKVPLGTEVYDEFKEELLVDLVEPGQQFIAAKGGKGGAGNHCFKSSTNRSPKEAIAGEAGEELVLNVKMKLMADVGLVGMPNAGKSTFLSVVSAAKPKIASYPFTTLKPQLGVVDLGYSTLVVADIPGLIEGASEGIGLGLQFLSHVERCKVILHLIDSSSDDPVRDYKIIRHELAEYTKNFAENPFYEALSNKPEIIALTKAEISDIVELENKKQELAEYAKSAVVIDISSATGHNMKECIRLIAEIANT